MSFGPLLGFKREQTPTLRQFEQLSALLFIRGVARKGAAFLRVLSVFL